LKSMNILALDTSTEFCSVALWSNGQVTEQAVHAVQTHSTILLEMVDAVCRSAAVHLGMLDAIAYGEGPGAFTGLRIACSVAQGLALVNQTPMIGISTLAAMALRSNAERVVCCLDARMNEVYHAAYERRGSLYIEVSAPCVCPPDQAPRLAGVWSGCGSGFIAYPQLLMQSTGVAADAIVANVYPHASNIAALAVPLLQADSATRGVATPRYVRNQVALKTAER
jgi:tRNA threonylcarbamoyladenosine biosynthesis protein TsaB